MHESLLCVSPRVTEAEPFGCVSRLNTDVRVVTRLADATRRLDRERYPAGLPVFDRTRQREFGPDAVFRCHRGMHSVGLLRPGHRTAAACSDLITEYSSDEHTAPVDPAGLANMPGHGAEFVGAAAAAAARACPGPRWRAECPPVGDVLAMTHLRAQIGRMAAVTALLLTLGPGRPFRSPVHLIVRRCNAQRGAWVARADRPRRLANLLQRFVQLGRFDLPPIF